MLDGAAVEALLRCAARRGAVTGLAAIRRRAYTVRSAHSVHSGMPTLRFGGQPEPRLARAL